MTVKRNANSKMLAKREGDIDAAAITDLLDKIQEEKTKIDRSEGSIVLSFIAQGKLLAQLRFLAKKNWGKTLQPIEIHPRVALRYIRLSESCLAEIGLTESDLLNRTPAELMKLEWLARLNREQLQELVLRVDCKQMPRSHVIVEVRKILGMTNEKNSACDVEGKINKLFQQLKALGERAMRETSEEEECSRIHAALDNGVRKIEQLLKDGVPTGHPNPDGE